MRVLRSVVPAVALLVACSAPTPEAPPDGGEGPGGGEAPSTLASFHRAESLVRQGFDALGGTAALREAGGITLVGRGTFDLATRLQGRHPDRPEPVPLAEQLAVDLGTGRVAYETHARVNPDADEHVRYVYDDQGRMLIVLHQSGQAFWVPGDEDHRRRYLRIGPSFLLEDALEQRHTLRYEGRAGDEERVGFVLPSGEPLTLLFAAEGGRLTSFEYLLDLPIAGDSVVRWELFDPQTVPGLGEYPGGYRIFVGDRLLKEVRYETVAAGVAEAAVLAPPADIPLPEPPPPGLSAADPSTAPEEPALPEVRTLAPGVHLALAIRGGFHSLFVEMAESVVVVDAPAGYHELQMVPAVDWAGDVTSSSVGRRLLAAVRATVPDKPVRHVVLTHHHGDHAGGIRPFLAAGATVLASAVTAEVVKGAAAATFRLEPDELTGQAVTPRIEVVDGERVLADDERTIRILDVGENPHAEGMLVVYLPGERILYQSDLFMPSAGGFPDPARIPVMRWFVDWLDRSGLEPGTIYAIHGSARVTPEQLAAIRELE